MGFDGDELLYLDPHYSRPAAMEDLASYTCTDLRRITVNSIDPCFVAGFVISDKDALQKWSTELLQVMRVSGAIRVI